MTTTRPAVLGIDIGGTKIAAGVLAPDGELASFLVVPALSEAGPDAMLDRTIELARRVVTEAGEVGRTVDRVGIGCGGPLDPAAGTVNEPPNLPGWVDVPIVARMEAALSARRATSAGWSG